MAPRAASEFWDALESRTGAFPPRVRRFIGLGRHAEEYDRADGEDGREALLERVAECVQRHRESHLWFGHFVVEEPRSASDRGDGRWVLLRDLEAARAAALGPRARRPQPPVTARLDPYGWRAGPGGGRVIVTFDGRLSFDALQRELRALWPEFVAAGWVRRSRSLRPRSLALLRFVCLDAEPDTPWRTLRDRWDLLHPEWRYRSAWAFQSDLHRAEAALAGRRGGLDRFYDSAAREIQDMPAQELLTRVWAGQLTDEQERAFNRYAEWMAVAPTADARRSGDGCPG